MTQKEKLHELMVSALVACDAEEGSAVGWLVDYLIANGVMVQDLRSDRAELKEDVNETNI